MTQPPAALPYEYSIAFMIPSRGLVAQTTISRTHPILASADLDSVANWLTGQHGGRAVITFWRPFPATEARITRELAEQTARS